MHCLAVGVSSPKVCIYILQDADEGIIVIYVCQAAFRTETIDSGMQISVSHNAESAVRSLDCLQSDRLMGPGKAARPWR